MALVQYGPIVSDARKKIGGIVATKGHAGNFMRKKVSPIQPRTQSQRNVRADFTANSKAWAALSQTNIAGWNALAKATPKKDRFGNTVTLTGLQLYQSLSRNLSTVGEAPSATPPATLYASTPGNLTVVSTSGGSPALTVTPTNYPTASESAAIFASPQLSPGKTFIGKNYKLVLVVPYNVSPTAYAIETAYVALYGALISGKKIAVLVKNINTTSGAAGQPSAGSAITT